MPAFKRSENYEKYVSKDVSCLNVKGSHYKYLDFTIRAEGLWYSTK